MEKWVCFGLVAERVFVLTGEGVGQLFAQLLGSATSFLFESLYSPWSVYRGCSDFCGRGR